MLMSNEVKIASVVDPMTTVGRIVSVLEVRSMTPVKTREHSLLPRKRRSKPPEASGSRDLHGSLIDILGQ